MRISFIITAITAAMASCSPLVERASLVMEERNDGNSTSNIQKRECNTTGES